LIQEPWNALKPGEHMHSRTTFNKLTAHMMSLKNLYIWCFYVFVILGLPFLCFAQELEPRRWSHLPTGKNFVGGGYSYTKADIFLVSIFAPLNCFKNPPESILYKATKRGAGPDWSMAFPVPSNEVVCQILSCDSR
jgi:hypothetical protein